MKMKPETRRRLEIFADIVYTLVLGFPFGHISFEPGKIFFMDYIMWLWRNNYDANWRQA